MGRVFSGPASEPFWTAVRLAEPNGPGVLYAFGCQAQAMEHSVERLQAIVEAAWEVRIEEKDYATVPDLVLRADRRRQLYVLLDEWKAADAAGGDDASL